MKKLILFISIISFSFGLELNFKKSSMNEFELQGFSSKVIYKNKVDRDIQIGKLWDKFLSSKGFDIKKSSDKKLFVVYSNYKTNSLDCFIGIKSRKLINSFKRKLVPKSKYQKSILKYTKGMNLSDVWDEMQKQKIDRNFKIDIEQYNLIDLEKDSYFVNIYLSL